MAYTWPAIIDYVLALDTVGDFEKAQVLDGNFRRILSLT
jgi:hypothetical protein